MSALDYVSCHGYFEVAKLLFEHGADVDVQNGFGQTPKLEALVSRQGRITELLSSPR